jgi:hypothetical protein
MNKLTGTVFSDMRNVELEHFKKWLEAGNGKRFIVAMVQDVLRQKRSYEPDDGTDIEYISLQSYNNLMNIITLETLEREKIWNEWQANGKPKKGGKNAVTTRP